MPIPASWSGPLLSLLRIVTALGFIEHGTSKLWHFPRALGSPDALTLPLGLLETIGGALILFGLFTRPVAFLLSGQMAVAYWWIHVGMGGPYPLANGGEGAMLYCFIFLYLAAAGGGDWSLDRRIGKSRD